MSKDRLTKNEAKELITSVVDGEVDDEIRSSFLEYIQEDEEVRQEYESFKRIKNLIANRCPTYEAPAKLKLWAEDFLSAEQDKLEAENEAKNSNRVAVDIPSHIPAMDSNNSGNEQVRNAGSSKLSKWLYAIAASILIIVAFWGLIYNNQPVEETYNMEEYVYRHFENNDGKLVPPNITTASLADAEVSLSSNFDINLTIPPLKNSEFKGVAFSEFVPGFQTPLLEYYLPEEDQYIYIFAFKMDALNQFGNLVRSQEAVKKCVKRKDFHVKNVNGKHVVSWRWNNIWYAAISNHNGDTLASLVEPLNYETNTGN